MEERCDIAVIGAGFAGIGAAWQLIEHGLTDFVVVERGDEVGGTWRDNSYPGAACDIKSDLYSFSFAPNPGWRWTYGRQPEILEYLIGVSRRRGIREHIRFGVELERATWDAEAGRWTLLTSQGTLSARVLLSGHGPLIDPQWPAIPGLESFTGHLFHSSRWDHTLDLTGKRVAVIGTGASAIQIVPALQAQVERLTVYQRTPPWIIARHDRPTSRIRRRVFATLPILQRARRAVVFTLNDARWFGFTRPRIGAIVERVASRHLAKQVSDPALRARLHPEYRIGCKRVLVSDDFYPAIQRPNVELVTDAIERIEADAIVTRDGVRRPVDVIVCATGFTATRPRIAERIVGDGGRVLADVWSGGMFALRGSTVPGFPNLYILTGPNTALAHNSVVFMIEAQIHYAIDALEQTGFGAVVDARPAAATRYNRWLDRSLARGVWSRGGCTSFYLDASGRNTALWPLRAASFRRTTHRFDPNEYRIEQAPSVADIAR
ncbi:flavin-containing monooxygenase [Leifsonia poae]|uniref:flavin-containing monooxygenase n=1 Tax=Leifsonia poae TaxID=110933 RepID=UPI003D6760D9